MKAHFDGQSPYSTVVETVATVIRTDPRKMSPLAETINPDAVAGVVSSPGDGPRLTFTYEGTEVIVTSEYVVVKSGDSDGSR